MDHIQLKSWVDKYTDDLYSWANFKTSSTELAEDLVQDTFLVAAEKMESFKGGSSPKTWLFSILNHKIIDFYRKKVNQTTSADDKDYGAFFDNDGAWHTASRPLLWDNDTHLLDDDQFQLALSECLAALPEKWNLCVKLKYLAEENTEDICQELGIATTNLWQIIHRAKVQLRNCIDNNWFNN